MAIELKLKPSRRELRQFGMIALIAFGSLGAWILWRRSILGWHLAEASVPVAYVFWAVGALAGAFSLLYPGANRPLWVVLNLVTYPIGLALSFVLMALVFYCLFAPLGLLFRVTGRDVLCRRFEPERESYWALHRPSDDARRYFRQF